MNQDVIKLWRVVFILGCATLLNGLAGIIHYLKPH